MNTRYKSPMSRWLTVSIVIAHVLLGVLYSVVTPLWESFDEWGHYPYVEYVAQERALPSQPLSEANDETHQPPLYYVLGAIATFWFGADDDLPLVKNDYSVHRGGEGGVNFYLHLEEEDFPYRGTALAAHVVRLLSVLLSTVSILATHSTARTLFPDRKDIALGALAVSAFWPQLLFMGSVVNNDIMVTASASLVLLFTVRTLLQSPSRLNLLGLGLSLGATLLSKRNGLALVPFVFTGLVVVGAERLRVGRASTSLLSGALAVLGGVALTLVWSLDRLMEAYRNHILRIFSTLSSPTQLMRLRWERLPSGLYFCLATFFASFGHLPLGVEAWVYKLLAVIFLIACLGLCVFFLRRQSRRLRDDTGVILLVIHVLAVVTAPAYRVLTEGSEMTNPIMVGSVQSSSPLLFSRNVFLLQGRFVLPAISSFSVLFILGLTSLVPERFAWKVSAAVGLVLLAFSTLAPFRYIRPAYARPRQLLPSDVQGLDHHVRLKFGDKIELLGYEMEADDTLPGDRIPVRLCWRRLSEMERNYALRIEALGPDAEVYGSLQLHPGYGSFPTSLWEEHTAFCETYRVRVSEDVAAPSLAYFRVAFVGGDPAREEMRPVDMRGHVGSGTIGRFVVRAREEPEIDHPTYYELGGKAALVGYRINSFPHEGRLDVTLFWRALADMETDYTVFVHLVDENGGLVAQGDSQPRNGSAPTSIWKEGELIADEHTLSLRPTIGARRCSVHVGMYDIITMERLQASDAGGARLADGLIPLKGIGVCPIDDQAKHTILTSRGLLARAGHLQARSVATPLAFALRIDVSSQVHDQG